MKRIRRDKLLKELKDIADTFDAYSKIVKGSDHSVLDVSFFFALKDLHDLIAKLDGTYKSLDERLAELAKEHLNDEPNLKTVQYKFKPGGKKNETPHHERTVSSNCIHL